MKTAKNSMVGMATAPVHICTTCGAEYHGPRPTKCQFECQSTEFTPVSSLSEANTVSAHVLATRGMILDGTTGDLRTPTF
jgi:hypothetical protein